ncbi:MULTISPECIES: AmmeMemoRadiSam system protein A [Desulfococcus]|nr:AmmeMemoRadiSam system protein A [Desulfococcus multivorans]AOY58170.1 AMMECR1 domain protein [Desulfococcus multivorans]MDX9818910.1 AmmeMemoRadiSam system protein A [Desulfococcus multivorans]
MKGLTDDEKRTLLAVARAAIVSKLHSKEATSRPEAPSPPLGQLRGCFVSLHKKRALRGCIGIIEPIAPLIDGIHENALNAAFRDPRFSAVEEKELGEIEIEISVLTPPQPLVFSNPEALLAQLKPGVHGVILSKGGRRSTFLPQVWHQLPEKERFLEHLCLKAGMKGDCWKDAAVKVHVYEVESFSESDLS